jgi:uroporphyrinogen decarboxylase
MHLFEKMSQADVDAISLDSREAGVDLPAVASQVSSEVAIVGNISPTGSILNGSPEDVSSEVLSLLDKMAPYSNFILSTGCDLPQETPYENIKAFMDVGRSYRLKE